MEEYLVAEGVLDRGQLTEPAGGRVLELVPRPARRLQRCNMLAKSKKAIIIFL